MKRWLWIVGLGALLIATLLSAVAVARRIWRLDLVEVLKARE